MPQTNKYAFSGQKSGGRGLGTASAAEKARDGIPYRFPKSGFSPILAGIGAGVHAAYTAALTTEAVASRAAAAAPYRMLSRVKGFPEGR